jgi:hypothetical protein
LIELKTEEKMIVSAGNIKLITSQAPKGMLSLIETTNNGNNIQLADIIALLQEDIEAIKDDIKVLRLADLKTSKQNFMVGLEQYAKAAESGRDDTSIEGCWKTTLNRASLKANDAYNRVKHPEDKIECFWIICTCALATDSPKAACIKIRGWIDLLLNEDEAIKKALEDLKRCVYERNVKMALETKDLLSSLFKRLRGILVSLFYLYEQNDFGVQERNELTQILKKFPHLCDATKKTSEWKYIKVYHSKTLVKTVINCTFIVPILAGGISAVTSAATLGMVRPKVPTTKTSMMGKFDEIVISDKKCSTILQTAELLNAFFHNGSDFKLEADMIDSWLPPTQKREEKYRTGITRKPLLPYKSTEWYCSLFAGSIISAGLFYYLLSCHRSKHEKMISNATNDVTYKLLDHRKLSNNAKKLVEDAIAGAKEAVQSMLD